MNVTGTAAANGFTTVQSETAPAASNGQAFLDAMNDALDDIREGEEMIGGFPRPVTIPGPGANGMITGQSIRERTDELKDIFHEAAIGVFRGLGVDTSEPIELGVERGSGRVIVTNNHPDAAVIEKAFEDNFDLRNLYVGIQSNEQLLRAAEEHMEFAEAYEADPVAAVARYSYLWEDDDRYDTRMTLSEDMFVAYFTDGWESDGSLFA